MMDSFAERIAAGLAVDAEPPAGLAEDILRDVRRGRRLRRAGTVLAALLLVTAVGLAAAWTGGGRRDAVRADALAAFTGAGGSEQYEVPAGATVLALAPSGAALAVSGGTRKTLWLLRPGGNWTVLDHGHSRLADWATDGTLVAWTWTAEDERGWKCLDRPGDAPVALKNLDPTAYQRMFADQGHLVWGYGDTYVLDGCQGGNLGKPKDLGDTETVGLRWPDAYTWASDSGGRVTAADLRTREVTPTAVKIPTGGSGNTVGIADEQGALWVTDPLVNGRAFRRWSFGGQPAGGRATTLATLPWSNGVRRASAGRSLLAMYVTRRPHESPMHLAYDDDPATSVVYVPATGRHLEIDGAVFVAGDLLLHREHGGYRLYRLPG